QIFSLLSSSGHAASHPDALSLHDALPISSLNPGMTIGQSIADPLIIHEAADEKEAKRAALEIMTEVGLSPAEQMYRKYPARGRPDRKSTRLNSSHGSISYAVFCLKKKKKT